MKNYSFRKLLLLTAMFMGQISYCADEASKVKKEPKAKPLTATNIMDNVCEAAFENELFQDQQEQCIKKAIINCQKDIGEIDTDKIKDKEVLANALFKKGNQYFKQDDACKMLKLYQLCAWRATIKGKVDQIKRLKKARVQEKKEQKYQKDQGSCSIQ